MSFTSPLSGVLPPRLLLHGESRIPSFFGGRRVQGVLHLSPLLVSAPSAPSGRARGCIPSPWMRPKRLRLHRWSVPTLKLQWRSRIRRRPPAMPSRVSRVGKRCAPQARACHRLKKALIFRTNAEFRATRQRYVEPRVQPRNPVHGETRRCWERAAAEIPGDGCGLLGASVVPL